MLDIAIPFLYLDTHSTITSNPTHGLSFRSPFFGGAFTEPERERERERDHQGDFIRKYFK